MKVILLKDVPKLGRKDQVVEVNQGHAINLLIPKKLARAATAGDVKSVQNKNEALKKSSDEKIKKGRELLSVLKGETINIFEKANEKGHLFSKVPLNDVIEAVEKQTGIKIDSAWIKNFDQIKSVGEFKINLEAFGEKSNFLLNISNR
ncbi:MAG: 50S ribosomal protein L9 [Candidatus Pacebacteria bacterium]|nr:50S ribosomal protein L9 [Candidatus Paceibacterota bacterium]